MGQQQLLLLVMGIILVGIAIMAGFYAFEEKSKQFVVDNLVNRNLEIANAATFWKAKKDPLAGGNAKYAGLATNGLDQLRIEAETNYGEFEITSATDNTLVITGVSSRWPDLGARTYVNRYSIDSTTVSYTGDITLQ
ncbi:MAG: hypothetical protein HKN17_10680 [Rhodothermales bacterium]|nr:hypothetical protein [Rhodothermales bacterium]